MTFADIYVKVALLEGKRVIKVDNPELYQLVYPQPILNYTKTKQKTMLKVKKTRLMACQDRIDFQVQGKNLLMMTMTLRDDKR